jgi:hypothetical protein
MDYLDFYKSLYNRELQRRFDLDNALNIPIGLIAILIASAFFIVSNISECDRPILFWMVLTLTIIAVLCILIAIIFLSLSYNRMFLGFKYKNFVKSAQWREFQKQIESHNKKNSEDKMDFEEEFIQKLNFYTDSHSEINNKRQKRLRDAKSFIILSLLFLFTALIIVVLNKYLI